MAGELLHPLVEQPRVDELPVAMVLPLVCLAANDRRSCEGNRVQII
jgi:hypothetical protein